MKIRSRFLTGGLGAVAIAGALASAAVLTSPGPQFSSRPAALTVRTAAVPAGDITSPIGPITPAENSWLHTHPVNMTRYRSDAGYRAQTLGQPAMKATAVLDSKHTFWGYFCAGWGTECLNTWGGGNGGDVFFGSGVRGNANGEFSQWWYGQVGPSWPIPSTQFYTHFRNEGVYQYCWAPHGVGSNLCLDQRSGPGGALQLDYSIPGAREQMFLWAPSGFWVAVLWTGDSFLTYEDRGVTYWLTASQRSNGHIIYVSNHLYTALKWGAFPGG